ncbi:MAG: hypothetical protein AB7S38_33340 [Vulcanimicrobiota bacterium]
MLVILTSTFALARPADEDVNWAHDILGDFASKGLLRVNPRLLSDSSESRWEVALEVARLVEDLQGDARLFVTHSELDALRQMVTRFETELSQFGVRPNFTVPRLNPLDVGPINVQLFDVDFTDQISLTARRFAMPETSSAVLENIRLDWKFDPDLRLYTGVDKVTALDGIRGVDASSGYVGLDRRLTTNTSVNLDIRYQSSLDQLSSPQIDTDGWQVKTQFVVRF